MTLALLSIADVALHSGVPAGTIRRWLAEGLLTRYGSSKPWRVDLYHVIDLRDKGRS